MPRSEHKDVIESKYFDKILVKKLGKDQVRVRAIDLHTDYLLELECEDAFEFQTRDFITCVMDRMYVRCKNESDMGMTKAQGMKCKVAFNEKSRIEKSYDDTECVTMIVERDAESERYMYICGYRQIEEIIGCE